MGGLQPPPGAEVIANALTSHVAGNSLELHRLHHLFANAASSVASLLHALTHLTVRLHAGDDFSAALRSLIDAALTLNLQAALENAAHVKCKPDESAPRHDVIPEDQRDPLSAFASFAINLISIDASYLEPLLNLLVTKLFLIPVEQSAGFEPLIERVVVAAINTHARATHLLTDAISRRYPHPVRPVAEHIAFSRAILFVSRVIPSAPLVRAIMNSLFERLSAIEATVPGDVRDIKLLDEKPAAPDSARFKIVTEDGLLCPDAFKLQAVMVEIVRHFDLTHERSLHAFQIVHLDALFRAYDTYVVPVHRTRFTPYILIYASSLAGRSFVHDVTERLRQAFFDSTQGIRLRGYVLEHSAVMVCRANYVSISDALSWLARLASWLHAYIDTAAASSLHTAIDVDVHGLFYSACATFMATLARRPDIIEHPSSSEALARLRISRLLHSCLAPTLVLPSEIVISFLDALAPLHGGTDVDLSHVHEKSFAPTRTKYGASNRLSYAFRCPDLPLPTLRSKIDRFTNWDTTLDNKMGDSISTPLSESSTQILHIDPVNISIPT